MAAFSRGLRSFIPRGEYTCLRCLQFSTTATVQSGHSRWSKIKHDKGAADAKLAARRTAMTREIVLISKLYGPDPVFNPRLATILAIAKKGGLPKATLEAAIARGQGKSSTGASLENIMLEVIMPPSIGMIVEAETDSRARTLSDLRFVVKTAGGSVTPTSYLFKKKGRVSFETMEKIGVDEVLDTAIEAGAEDVEAEEDGSIVVWTEPNTITTAADALSKNHGLKVESLDILWDPNEDTKVQLEPGDAAEGIVKLIDALRENSNVQGVYANVAQGSLSEEAWDEIQGKLDN